MLPLATLSWPILERIPLGGDFAVSPHGISIAVGFLVGAQLMLRRSQKRGLARRWVPAIPEVVQNLLIRAAIGTIVGARFFYILTHFDQFRNAAGAIDWLGFFTIWEGGLSLLGGIFGGVLFAVPYALRRRLSMPLLLDSTAIGLAVGIFIGRIGDLIIGEHLGAPTDFFLAWHCSGNLRDVAAPYPYPGNPADITQGCFDIALHQTALYDFLAGGIVLAILLLLERRPRFDGFFIMTFVVLYGTGRFFTDFARESEALFSVSGVDITGSQVAVVAAIIGAFAWFAITRPDRLVPYAWNPPDFSHPWDAEAAEAMVRHAEQSADTAAADGEGAGEVDEDTPPPAAEGDSTDDAGPDE